MDNHSQLGSHVTNQLMSAAAARNHYAKHPEELQSKVSATRAFFRGAFSGLGTGALMSVIVASVMAVGTLFSGGLAAFGIAAFLTPLISTAAVMIPAASLFTGVMEAFNHSKHRTPARRQDDTDMIIAAATVGAASPSISQSQEASLNTPEQAPAKSWVSTTNRGADSQSRVQHILDQGLADKDRAQAILAAREAANAAPVQGRA